jgi:hypothetical protein
MSEKSKPDFIVRIQFIPERNIDHLIDPDGSTCYRPQFHYPDFPNGDWLIFPLRLTRDGEAFLAEMHILDRSKLAFHQARLHPGTRIAFREGWRVVATGEVVELSQHFKGSA